MRYTGLSLLFNKGCFLALRYTGSYKLPHFSPNTFPHTARASVNMPASLRAEFRLNLVTLLAFHLYVALPSVL